MVNVEITNLQKKYYNIYAVEDAIHMIKIYFEKIEAFNKIGAIECATDDDLIITKSLLISSIVSFRRCFEKGVNNEVIKIENILNHVDNKDILFDVFGKLLEIRDKELIHLRFLKEEQFLDKHDRHSNYKKNKNENITHISSNNISFENGRLKITQHELFLTCDAIGIAKNDILQLFNKTLSYLYKDAMKLIRNISLRQNT